MWKWEPSHSDLQFELGVHPIDWHRGLKGGAVEQTTGIGSWQQGKPLLLISLRFERAWCVSVRVIRLSPQDSEHSSRLRTASRSRLFEVKWNWLYITLTTIAHCVCAERSRRGSLGITQSWRARKSRALPFQNRSECSSNPLLLKGIVIFLLVWEVACPCDPLSNYTLLRAPLWRCIAEPVCVFVTQV